MKTTLWRDVRDADLAPMTGQERAEYDAAAIEAELALDLAEKGLQRSQGRRPVPSRAGTANGHRPARHLPDRGRRLKPVCCDAGACRARNRTADQHQDRRGMTGRPSDVYVLRIVNSD
ncbi:MAG: hypothetical protein ACRDP5_18520, partial [Streptosporangiaceae bacterium]